jgi:hypothetical protein
VGSRAWLKYKAFLPLIYPVETSKGQEHFAGSCPYFVFGWQSGNVLFVIANEE